VQVKRAHIRHAQVYPRTLHHLILSLLLFSGLDNAGKTTILKKFNGEDINTISPTLGFNIKTLEHKGFNLNIWDVGGQKSLRSYWRNYFETTDGLIWVVDSADKRRLADCKEELHKLLQEEVRHSVILIKYVLKRWILIYLVLNQFDFSVFSVPPSSYLLTNRTFPAPSRPPRSNR
jgi:small GTP-binding protein